jgi:hypothetical protein
MLSCATNGAARDYGSSELTLIDSDDKNWERCKGSHYHHVYLRKLKLYWGSP